MKKLITTAVISGALMFSATTFAAMNSDSVMVGGAAMYPQKNIIENALNSKDHTTLVAAVKAAGLVETLEGKGPFTVFAPTNAAFAKLPAGTVDNLVKPENKAKLTSILTYHVVAGKYDMKALMMKIKQGGGHAELKTVNGQPLWIMSNGPHNIQLKDGQGNVANISTYDVNQKNGVIDVIDTVLMPK
ncbi:MULTISPECIES: fasciclin domain-containing protein [Erwiniaceae]|uniref:fasciclin domain-containing protein n=1 Tax=Erwiniaceae TaxID=1903409 RepID=UPI0005F7F8DE|nr:MULTISPECIES: fasciclin domain-containing protein [Erwiniaceae]KJV33004.1 fasciclin [Pantoea sp. SM3]MBK0091194.1 fasciclin domain-containing protein [Erwinia sp. S59]MBK0122486.1 fasciclin domain-containing protein [Pantoea sp. S61]MBK0122805.1 fasciclin domain-containing protein [Pantoea sp. S61]